MPNLETALIIPPAKVRKSEWELIRDMIDGEGHVGFYRGDTLFLVSKELAREYLLNKGKQ